MPQDRPHAGDAAMELATAAGPQHMRPRPVPQAACASDMIGQVVVLDTAGPIIYIGTLRDIRDDGFALQDADVHDCRDGHAGKELYICESRADGVHANRRSVFVFRHSVLSMSPLDDVIVD